MSKRILIRAMSTGRRRRIAESQRQLAMSGSQGHVQSSDSLPWGSLPKPDFGAIRASTNLSPTQVDSLIKDYLPEDTTAICKQRSKLTKTLVKRMRRNEMDKLREQLGELRSGVTPLDETMFVTMIFGHLQLRGGLVEAESVVAEMMKSEFIHPSLKSAMSSFVASLRTLEQFDAFPNRTAILKSLLPFLEIATEVRKMRILAFRVAMSDRIKNGEVILPREHLRAESDSALDAYIKEALDREDDEK
jgi:hypothetical protein